MVAAPFKVLLTFAIGAANSANRITLYASASDVATQNYVWQNGQDNLLLPNQGTMYLVDVQIDATSYGTDTTQGLIYVNGRATPYNIVNSACLTNGINRQFQVAPLAFPSGGQLIVQQAA